MNEVVTKKAAEPIVKALPMRPVYLDYAATTPVAPEVASVMQGCLTAEGHFGNSSSSSHWYGWQADELIEQARAQLADLLVCDTREIVWTSGATEANNLAIKGVLLANSGPGRHIITSAAEHKAVLDVASYAEHELGYTVTFLKPQAHGRVSVDQVREALTPDTVLVSLMHVNNEVGAINPVEEISTLTSERGVIFHVDAAQSLGKLPLDMSANKIDLMSFSSHKVYGPKGVGALYIRRSSNLKIAPQMHGGSQERGFRAGTLATHQIAGMGMAAELCTSVWSISRATTIVKNLRERFLLQLAKKTAVQWQINGDDKGYPGILNIYFEGVDSEVLLSALGPHVAVSSGSACTSLSVDPSHVLSAMGLDRKRALASIRFSFGRSMVDDEVDYAITHLCQKITALAN